MGIIGTVQRAVTVAFAVPVGLLGVDYLLRGRPSGAVFLALAIAMVVVEEYVTSPIDIPGKAAERVTGAIVKDPDEDDQ